MFASTPAEALDREIGRIAERTGAAVGVSARHLGTGEEIAYQAGLRFPMASTYKVAIAACALRRVDRGDLELETLIPVLPRQRSTSSILSTYFPEPGLSVSVQNLLELMLTQSDNTATDVILEAVGGAQSVQQCLHEAGLSDMRVDRTTAQILRDYGGVAAPADSGLSFDEQFRELLSQGKADVWFEDGGGAAYGAFERDPRDQATPREMTRLLAMIWEDRWLSSQSGKVIRDILAHSGEPVRLGRSLPGGTPLAHKTGTLSGTVNDSGVIVLPDGRGQVVLTVYVKNLRGPWDRAEEAIGDIARAIYDYYLLEPGSHR